MNALEIKENRKKLGLTQAELAKLIGVSLKTIGNYESGEVIPESKKALLLKVLSKNENNLLNEPGEGYGNMDGYDEQISNVYLKIKETKKIIKLSQNVKDKEKEELYTEILKLLLIQTELINTAKQSHIAEIKILNNLDPNNK
ncbi:helix-turn-helix domain-containing protein [Flavobacterium sp. WC2509]|uniref:helix-turn-helix domain-containing protein n=1 Tax=Flavobacterium sp. WC2509 TaxID=3461406 RepID=UPI004044EE7D